jgi:hypothetical protein
LVQEEILTFWTDVQEIFLLIYAPCIVAQLVLFFVPFGIFYGVMMWLRWLWKPWEGGDGD